MSVTESQSTRKRLDRRQHSFGAVLLNFFGSMELAITLLCVVGIASVIGTVLQQNQPYNDYIIKFGPYWFEVFKRLELFNIYSAWWFVALLGFLLVSTSVCVYRNAPTMIREINHFRFSVTEKSLRLMHSHNSWQTSASSEESVNTVSERLAVGGYKVRQQQKDGATVLSAKKGGINRLGYLFSHLAIIVICLGALLDGDFGLKIREVSGSLKPEMRSNLPASEVPDISRLGPDENHAFRGNVTVPEGAVANLVFLGLRDGYLVQELPFAVELKDFRIEHYESGQPKSFESDVIIHDDKLEEPIETTISVNHPLIYDGYAIFQSSFEDGGSKLEVKAWPLDPGVTEPLTFNGEVTSQAGINTSRGEMTVEFRDFRLFNINPNPKAEETGHKFINLGPNFTFRVRNPSGEANEYVNYMMPMEQEGRLFFVSGVRKTVADPFRYIHIPADDNGSVERFFAFRNLLQQDDKLWALAQATAQNSVGQVANGERLSGEIAQSMVRLVKLFNQGGFDAIGQYVAETVPTDRQADVTEAYFKVLQTVLWTMYTEQLYSEGITSAEQVTEAQALFFDDAVNALSAAVAYDSPFYLQLTNFEHIQASGFQIAKAPGQNIVYLGCVMLTVGILLMFYVPHRRIWAIIKDENGKRQVTLAGSGDRHQKEFANEFNELSQSLDKRFKA